MRTFLEKKLGPKDKGFTLIELLVVIIIIGILAAIAIPIFLNQRKKAVDASMKSDIRTIATQLETYNTDVLSYPGDAEVVYTPAVPGTSAGQVEIGDPNGTPEVVVLSDVNVPAIYLNTADPATATAFCVEISSAKGTHPWVWVSNKGGQQPGSVTTCLAADAAFAVGNAL